ncbi:E3 ubiquitin-protein ligase FANCL isoform X3 [Anarrhichthys ocellatus]|nr:E3 ubiquitin-protein ligase FANCL isoform X3 [Anarrhichthys ocellatus]
MESALVKDNPLLFPLNKQKTLYDGFITVLERDFRLRVLLPPDGQLKGARLHCCWQLRQVLQGYEHTVKQRLQQSADLVTFILELKTVLEVGLKSRPECRSIPPPRYYSQLISEMETLGWGRLLFIDTEFRTLRLKAEDSSGRQHVLAVKLKSRHPAEAPECSADLPVPLDITWTPQSTLDQLHSQFLLVLESLTEFWEVLDEIDSKTWILEPEKPSRSDTMRRIAIGMKRDLSFMNQRIHQSGAGSQTPQDAARVLPAGSRARWVGPHTLASEATSGDSSEEQAERQHAPVEPGLRRLAQPPGCFGDRIPVTCHPRKI